MREFHLRGMERVGVLKRNCGWTTEANLLKQTSKDRNFIHAAGALRINACKSIEISKTVPENLANK